MKTPRIALSALLIALLPIVAALAQTPLGTAFTYQGRLADAGVPPTGAYDLQFRLFDAAAAGSQVGGTVTLPSVAVTGGLFTVKLDFGASAFTGSARWLEIGVRPGGSASPFTILSPRQELTPAPGAIFSSTAPWSGVTAKPAGFADNVDNDSGGDITGVTAGTGLTGGGVAGDVTLGVIFSGSGAAASVSRSDHDHFGQAWTGTFGDGLRITKTADVGSAIFGRAAGTGIGGTGLFGQSDASDAAYGVFGRSTSTGNGFSYGVYGESAGGTGVYGSGRFAGVQGISTAPGAYGVLGAGQGAGVAGETSATDGQGVWGRAFATTGTTYGIHGESFSADGRGVFGRALASTGVTYGVYGESSSSQGTGVYGTGQEVGVRGDSSSPNGRSVYGYSSAASGPASGVFGVSFSPIGRGVAGEALGGFGVYGHATSATGFGGFFENTGGGAALGVGATGIRFADGTTQTTAGGGDITAVNAGTGLSGGGSSGDVTLAVNTAVIQSRVTGSCAPGGSIQTVNENGSVTCQPDSTGNDWSLTGNLGTNPITNFVGTLDNQPLELRVGGARALRLEPGPSPNVVGGHAANSAASIGAAIGGGGEGSLPNVASGVFATIGGGHGNVAANDATVGGGILNKATGPSSTVPGGIDNEAAGSASFATGTAAKVRASDNGTFVWADSAGGPFTSTGQNQFLIRSAGGMGINTEAPTGDLQLGRPNDATAFRFGNAGARHHLISNRDMVFNAFDSDGIVNDSNLFLWRQNFIKFDENTFINHMTLSDTGFLSLFGGAFIAGDLVVAGTLTKGGGTFKIDHPLDPRNKYLSHSFVESPDMMNIYNGNVTTGADGLATVELPEWFEALNRDFRYQLTVVGTGAWARARVAREIERNRFVVETDVPGTKVSWQVTGIRHDAWAEKHRIRVEEDKPLAERGRLLHPDAFGAEVRTSSR